MKPASFARMLRGSDRSSDRRSIGNSNRVAADLLKNSRRLPQLIECLWSDDPIVRMRAADAAEKISVSKPELLAPFKAELLGLADESAQAELRWHLAMMLPRLPLSAKERRRAASALRSYLSDRSSIVKTWALNGMAELAEGDAAAEAEIVELLERAGRSGTPAMKARSRKLLRRFLRNDSNRTAISSAQSGARGPRGHARG